MPPINATVVGRSPKIAMAASDVTVDAPKAFPESLSSTANGTLYIGSLSRGEVYRALPGEKTAKLWISKEAGNFGHKLAGIGVFESQFHWAVEIEEGADDAIEAGDLL